MLPFVFYLNKKDNLPFYSAGKELHTVEYDRGWVEYLLETSDLYFIRLTTELIQQYNYIATLWIETAWIDQIPKHLSVIKQLSNTRLDTPFSLPLFADWRKGPIFTCGSNRFTAEILCGTGPNQIPVFFQTEKGKRPPELSQAIAITSTEQAESIAQMQDIDYRLAFDRNVNPSVMNSVLRNSVYEADAEYKTFEEDGKVIVNFWNKFIQDKKINITVTCNENSKKYIKFNPHIWNVNFVFKQMAGFSFGEILSKFNQPDNQYLNLYVYDLCEEFNLAYLLPWTTTNSVWYHSVNKKINLFDTSRGAATACWPIVPMGNFVK
jgi:hypothetical protein